MAKDQYDVDLVEQGQQATFVLGATRPLKEDQQKKILAKLINHYRAGTATPEILLGGIAEISALDLFEDELRNQQRLGNGALDRMMTDG